MQYREVRPRSPLQRFVECFWFVNGDGTGAPVRFIGFEGELARHFVDPQRLGRFFARSG